MKTAGKETQIDRPPCLITEHWGGARSEQTLLIQVGWTARKRQPLEACFFLTSPFIEVVSMGRRNTFLKFTRRSLKT